MSRLARGLATFLAAFLGCADRSPKAEEFVPSEAAAAAALEQCLQSWTRGEAASPVPGTRPAVKLVDSIHLKGRTLLKYEILGPVPADAPRCFAVRLTLGNPAQELRERYVVLGIDPVWVWRHDDYVMISHWDHSMAGDKATSPRPPPKR